MAFPCTLISPRDSWLLNINYITQKTVLYISTPSSNRFFTTFAMKQQPCVCVHTCTHFSEVFLWVRAATPSLSIAISANNSYLHLFSSVQFSRSLVSDSLPPHELQHAWPPCPSPTPGVHSNSRLSSRWCHPAISSSVVPFSSCPQSLPASESFPMSQLFTWGGQSIRVSASASVLPKKSQDWSPLEWTGWISLHSKGLSRVFSNTTVQKHQLLYHKCILLCDHSTVVEIRELTDTILLSNLKLCFLSSLNMF